VYPAIHQNIMILPNNHVSDGLAPNFDSEPFTIISDGILKGRIL